MTKKIKINRKLKNKKDKWYYNLLIFVITIIIFLIIAEIITRVIYGKNLQYTETNDTIWELKPNQQGFTIPGKPMATINSIGFRGKEISKDINAYRIIIVGDSFAFGYGVADNETLAYFLEQKLDSGFGKDFEVLNFGVPGYGVFQMDALARKKITELNPDIIMMVMIKSDVFRQPVQEEDSNFFIRKILRTILRKSSFAALMKPKLEIFRGLLSVNDQYKYEFFPIFWELDKERINGLHDYIIENDAQFIFVPYVFQDIDADFVDISKKDLNEDMIIVESIYPELREYANEHQEPLQLEDGHPTAQSYKIASESITETLINHQLI